MSMLLVEKEKGPREGGRERRERERERDSVTELSGYVMLSSI
jgi:hypothetical protein